VLDDARKFYSIDTTLNAFTAQAAKFGNFPLPTENTILAAELLRRCLLEAGAPAAGAISVVELRAAGRITFLTVASGGGIISTAVADTWEAMLRPLLESRYTTIQCTSIDTSALFYSPAHMDTVKFIKDAFPNFALPAMPLDRNDLQAAIQAVNALGDGEFGLSPQNSQQMGNLTPVITAIHQLLAVAVALRINAYNSVDVGAAKQSLSQFRTTQKKYFAYLGHEEIVENVEALALRGGNPYQYAFREDPGLPVSNIKKIQAKLAEAWRVGDLNRFCAEPKAFTYIKTHGLRDPIAGQLAMWWDSTRENRYKFSGSEASPYSDYMLPCSSCQARSGDIMAGVGITALTQSEEPIGHVAFQPQPRARSASFSG
jgi:hypothetical protein